MLSPAIHKSQSQYQANIVIIFCCMSEWSRAFQIESVIQTKNNWANAVCAGWVRHDDAFILRNEQINWTVDDGIFVFSKYFVNISLASLIKLFIFNLLLIESGRLNAKEWPCHWVDIRPMSMWTCWLINWSFCRLIKCSIFLIKYHFLISRRLAK